jgi:hypothetical protein
MKRKTLIEILVPEFNAMKHAHTQGPLEVEDIFGDGGYCVVLGYDVPGAGSPMMIGFAIGPGEHEVKVPATTEEAKANATLWAAAPDMLEACEAARLEIMKLHQSWYNDRGLRPSMNAVALMLEQVIAKATEAKA